MGWFYVEIQHDTQYTSLLKKGIPINLSTTLEVELEAKKKSKNLESILGRWILAILLPVLGLLWGYVVIESRMSIFAFGADKFQNISGYRLTGTPAIIHGIALIAGGFCFPVHLLRSHIPAVKTPATWLFGALLFLYSSSGRLPLILSHGWWIKPLNLFVFLIADTQDRNVGRRIFITLFFSGIDQRFKRGHPCNYILKKWINWNHIIMDGLPTRYDTYCKIWV